jgi:hypothetical protein
MVFRRRSDSGISDYRRATSGNLRHIRSPERDLLVGNASNTATYEVSFGVAATPTASFNHTINTPNAPATINFIANEPTASSYQWNFGNPDGTWQQNRYGTHVNNRNFNEPVPSPYRLLLLRPTAAKAPTTKPLPLVTPTPVLHSRLSPSDQPRAPASITRCQS